MSFVIQQISDSMQEGTCFVLCCVEVPNFVHVADVRMESAKYKIVK